MNCELSITVVGPQALLIVDDGSGPPSGYLVSDRASARTLAEELLSGCDNFEEALAAINDMEIPATGGAPTMRFEGEMVSLWTLLIIFLNQALEIQSPLPPVEPGTMCIARCLDQTVVIGFRRPDGEHRLLFLESESALRRAIRIELAWLPDEERVSYLEMMAPVFEDCENSGDHYDLVTGQLSAYLNTGSFWLDVFQEAEDAEDELNTGEQLNLVVTPEG